jgi:hypothetical protein
VVVGLFWVDWTTTNFTAAGTISICIESARQQSHQDTFNLQCHQVSKANHSP